MGNGDVVACNMDDGTLSVFAGLADKAPTEHVQASTVPAVGSVAFVMDVVDEPGPLSDVVVDVAPLSAPLLSQRTVFVVAAILSGSCALGLIIALLAQTVLGRQEL